MCSKTWHENAFLEAFQHNKLLGEYSQRGSYKQKELCFQQISVILVHLWELQKMDLQIK